MLLKMSFVDPWCGCGWIRVVVVQAGAYQCDDTLIRHISIWVARLLDTRYHVPKDGDLLLSHSGRFPPSWPLVDVIHSLQREEDLFPRKKNPVVNRNLQKADRNKSWHASVIVGSTVLRLFIKTNIRHLPIHELAHADINKTSNLHITGRLLTDGFPSHRADNVESSSISWCHLSL